MSATTIKQPDGIDPTLATERGQRMYLDFGFLRASADDYSRPDKKG